MQKLIGSILVLLACTGMGALKSRELQTHMRELKELKKIFTLLKRELMYTRAPLCEVFVKLSKKAGGNFEVWLKNLARDLEKRENGRFQEVWTEAIYRDLNGSRLTKEEREELCRIGSSLSYPEALELYLEQLEFSIQKTRDEWKDKHKLYQSMGIMAGIFLVILLL